MTKRSADPSRDKFWFRDKESPIDPQHSAKISPALSCLPEGKNKFPRALSLPKICSYRGCLSWGFYLVYKVLLEFQPFTINSHAISHTEKHAPKLDRTLKLQLSQSNYENEVGRSAKGAAFIAGVPSSSISSSPISPTSYTPATSSATSIS